MDSIQKPTDEEIFTGALAENDGEDQDRYVTENCAGNAQQRLRVLSLLDSHRKLANAKGPFVLDKAEQFCIELMSENCLSIGEQIGPYRVIRLLGEGGMGLVYEAEQISPIRRQVALKLLKPGMDSKSVLARFYLERQALAGMQHPGITQILDAGLADSGRPYFVMELVKGIAITDYCRTHQMQPLDYIRLMIQVCSAIQHAHQRGIIHRDIKPSNILVTQGDGGPIPKIIDFGIAKLINDSVSYGDNLTSHGEMIGTPAYISPEQALSSAEGVYTRSDVYSLGVLLFELLTGETPTASLNRDIGLSEFRQRLKDSRIELPSQNVKRRSKKSLGDELPRGEDGRPEKFLRGDVDCIVMKSLARDPNDRYQSVSELRRDLERFIDGLPIEAAPPSVFYQLRRFISRHRIITAIGSSACALVVAASAIAIWFGLVASDRLQAMLQMQSELKFERDKAVEAEKKTRFLAQSFLVSDVLQRSLRKFCIENWEQLVQVNPKLKSLAIPTDGEPLHPEINATISDSNLLALDRRLIVFGESKLLAKILSDISKREVSQWLMRVPKNVVAGETVPVDSLDAAKRVTSNSSEDLSAHADAMSLLDIDYSKVRNPTYEFPAATKKAYLSTFCEELREIDPHLPVVADTEDSLGLCLMDMQRADLAIPHFRTSIGIRENFPELQAQRLLSELFIADCLKRLEKRAESKRILEKVRSEVAACSQSLDVHAIERVNRTAYAIDEGENGRK